MYFTCMYSDQESRQGQIVQHAQTLECRSVDCAFYSVRILATSLIDSNPLILSFFSIRLMLAATTLCEFFFRKSFILTEVFL